MAYSMNDLKNAADKVEEIIEERSQKRGAELAGKVINGNFFGFLFARCFNYLTIYIVLGVLAMSLLDMNQGVAMVASMVISFFILKNKFFWYMNFRYAVLLFIAALFVGLALDRI